MSTFVEHIFAVRAQMVDGATIDLLLFADAERAREYAQELDKHLPLGFDKLTVVERRVIGGIVERRASRRDFFKQS